MTAHAVNDGFRILEEFVCEAIPAIDVSSSVPRGRGINQGVQFVQEIVRSSSQPSVSADWIAELRRLSTNELQALVTLEGSGLTGDELLVIFDIASERLGESETPFHQDAAELSRKVMLAAVNKGR